MLIPGHWLAPVCARAGQASAGVDGLAAAEAGPVPSSPDQEHVCQALSTREAWSSAHYWSRAGIDIELLGPARVDDVRRA